MGKEDDQLTELLAKLYDMQERTGSKPKTTDEQKKERAANVAFGKGRKAEKKGTRFLELKSNIIDSLKDIHKLMGEAKELEKAGFGGDNPKELIKVQAEIRERIRQATDEWKELDAIYKKEARKKRSKFTPEELEIQAELVNRLNDEIEKIRSAQMAGYTRNRADDKAAAILGSSHISSIPTGKKTTFKKGSTGVALTDNQRIQIQELEQRDADFDNQLDQIGEGILDLAEIAEQQGEEVKRQNAMLDNVNEKMDVINERVVNVNTRMKETLDEVGRSSEKLCVDIMCIMLAVGFGAVFYNMSKGSL
jgi:methyl-accepting chemotaxis protein